MFKRRQPFFVNLGIVWNSNDKKNQVIQDPCYKYGVTLYTLESIDKTSNWIFTKIILQISVQYISTIQTSCAGGKHFSLVYIQLDIFCTHPMWSTLFGESIKLTKHCWFLASIQTFHKYSDCISLCLPILSRVNCWSDKFIIAIISNSSHVSRFLCL